jgi:hypothetical protein
MVLETIGKIGKQLCQHLSFAALGAQDAGEQNPLL